MTTGLGSLSEVPWYWRRALAIKDMLVRFGFEEEYVTFGCHEKGVSVLWVSIRSKNGKEAGYAITCGVPSETFASEMEESLRLWAAAPMEERKASVETDQTAYCLHDPRLLFDVVLKIGGDLPDDARALMRASGNN